MTAVFSDKSIVILAKNPLTRLGILHFIQEADPDVRCPLESPCFLSLQEGGPLSATVLIVAELQGSDTAMYGLALQLIKWCHQRPHTTLVVYTKCRNITILSLLRDHRQISLIAQQGSLEQLRWDFRAVLAGNRVCSPAIEQYFNVGSVLQRPTQSALTRAERNVLKLLLNGLCPTEIAALTHRSIKTISTHKCNCMRKLGVRNDAELFHLSLNGGLRLGNTGSSIAGSDFQQGGTQS